MKLRSRAELFALAEQARDHDAIDRGAVGAAGHGFALANQVESDRLHAGGSKLTNLARDFQLARATGCVLTLTSGAVTLRSLREELFSLALFCVAPDGAQDLLSFYAGPSGLALGNGEQLEIESSREQCTSDAELRVRYERLRVAFDGVSAAWEAALRKVTPTAFALVVEDDFGTGALCWPVVRDGNPPKWSPSFPSADAGRAHEAVVAAATVDPSDGAAACRALEAIEAERGALTLEARDAMKQAYLPVVTRLWLPALEHVERELRAATGFELPREVELLANVLPCPSDRGIAVPTERAAAISDLAHRVHARRWLAHPWRW